MKVCNPFSQITKSVVAVLLLLFVVNGCGSGSMGSNSMENGSGSETFKSGSMSSGDTFSYTFENEGTFEYFCEFHEPDMQGEVEVASGTENTSPDTVEMIDLQFVPSQITVAPSTEIVWINRDNTSHTVTSGNPSGGGGY